MTDIRLISKRNRKIKPLVEAALANELRLLETGIRQTEERLQEFEKKYQMITQDFISRYENDEFEETMDFDVLERGLIRLKRDILHGLVVGEKPKKLKPSLLMNLERLKPYEQKDGIRKSSLSPFTFQSEEVPLCR